MSKENKEKLTSVGLVSYHASLVRKDRVKLKLYVSHLLQLSYYAVDGRFSGRQQFTTAELIALQPVIDNELWRE